MLFIGAIYRANGYQSACDATNGALTVWANGKKVAGVVGSTTVQNHKIDQNGNESWQCNMPFSVTVARTSRYALQWANATPYPNDGCTNSKSSADAEYVDDHGQSSAALPVISFTLLCTG